MLLRLIFALAFIALAGPAGAEGVHLPRCLLEVDGKTYVDGPCSFWREDVLGSFAISTFYREVGYYTAVVLVGTDKAFGHWNKEPGSALLKGKLGYLRRDGDCWVNENARLCTWKTGNSSHATGLFAGRCRMGECQWFAIDDKLLIASNPDGELFKVTVRGWVSFNAEPDYSLLDYDRPLDREGGDPGTEYFFCSAKRPAILWQENSGKFRAVPLNVHHIFGVTEYVIAQYFAACHGEIPSDDNDLARQHAYVDHGAESDEPEFDLDRVEDILRRNPLTVD